MSSFEYFSKKNIEEIDLDKVNEFIEDIYDMHSLVDLELVPVTNALEVMAKEIKSLRQEVEGWKGSYYAAVEHW